MDKFEAVRMLGLAYNFWQLTLNVADEIVKHENPMSMQFEGFEAPSAEEFEEHMKWSDQNIVEPLLFNFYHGMELSLKAMILAQGVELSADHKLSKLFARVEELYPNNSISSFYKKYIFTDSLPCLLNEFCNESGMTMDLYFQSLKYPTSTKGVSFNHSTLRARGEDGIVFLNELLIDLRSAREQVEKIVIAECADVLA